MLPPLDAGWLRQALPGRQIVCLESAPTTMTGAAQLAREGAPAGSFVTAEQQTSGQGRLGRSWHSEPRAGIYCSVVLRPKLPPSALPVLTLALGVAAHRVFEPLLGGRCDLRWPNDVLAGERKLAGILVRMEGAAAIAGFGVNVNHTGFPEPIAPLATSLRLETGQTHAREPLLVRLLEEIETQAAALESEGVAGILERFASRSSYARGKRVAVDLEDRVARGVTAGLDANGFLLLREDSGALTTLVAGGVRPVPS